MKTKMVLAALVCAACACSAMADVDALREKIVLSMDRFDFSRDGIRHRYLPDFLIGACS